jgi:hypothetical protein
MPAVELVCPQADDGGIGIVPIFNCKLFISGNNVDGLSLPTPGCEWQQSPDRITGLFPPTPQSDCELGCAVTIPSFKGLFPSSAFDDAMEMVFGPKTSVGFLCGVKEAVKDTLRNVTIPGYCCLDSPYDSEKSWGKSVSVWLRRRFLVSELNSSRTHDCVISSFYFLDVCT